jgi:quinol-cytochrome oxidoreductase complex cytochrome b subunit
MGTLGFVEILLIIGIIVLMVWAIAKGAKNSPTWKGIIISLILGLLPLYLILCFFGIMGEESPGYDRR